MPECTQDYLKALSMPFRLANPVCIPDSHVVPSKKMKIVLRGTGRTDANGFGYVTANPFYTANNSIGTGPTGDSYFGTIAYSNGNVTLPQIYTFGTAAGGSSMQPLIGAPYGIQEYDESPTGVLETSDVGAQSRVVGAGLRLRYSGTTLNKGGTALIVRREDGETLHLMGYDLLASRQNTKVVPYGDKWHEVSYVPVKPDDYDYCRNGAFGSTGTPDALIDTNQCAKLSRHCIAIVVKGAAAVQPFDWEYVVHLEFLGKTVIGASKSHSDLMGMSQVRNAVASTTSQVVPSGPGLYNTLVNSIYNEATRALPKLVSLGASKLLF